jgi:hypothetical protein
MPLSQQLVSQWTRADLAQVMELALNPRTDGIMSSVWDSPAWKRCVVDTKFSEEKRNLVLSLAADGIRPFKHSQRSIWPIVLKVT